MGHDGGLGEEWGVEVKPAHTAQQERSRGSGVVKVNQKKKMRKKKSRRKKNEGRRRWRREEKRVEEASRVYGEEIYNWTGPRVAQLYVREGSKEVDDDLLGIRRAHQQMRVSVLRS